MAEKERNLGSFINQDIPTTLRWLLEEWIPNNEIISLKYPTYLEILRVILFRNSSPCNGFCRDSSKS